MFKGWVLSFWATPDAQDPAGIQRFSQHFKGAWALVDGRLLVSVLVTYQAHMRDPVREAQLVVNRLRELIRVHVNELDFDLVTIADIAKRVRLTRQAVHNYVLGKRGPGDFPRPRRIGDTTRVWDWGAVNTWFYQVGKGQPFTPPTFEEISIINGWLNIGCDRGMWEATLVAPPPDTLLPLDVPAGQFAAAFLGVTSDDELRTVIKILNTSSDLTELEQVLDDLSARLPIEDRTEWTHTRTRMRAVAEALRAELNGSMSLQRHRAETTRRLDQERFELDRGYYNSDQEYGKLVLAIRIVCAGRGGHCGTRRGWAYYRPGRLPGSPYLLLTNHGDRYGDPLLEDLVRDFNDSTDVFPAFGCDHDYLVRTEPDGSTSTHRGRSVRMPNKLLEPLYLQFVKPIIRGGQPRPKPFVLRWAPGWSTTHYDPNPR